MKQWINETYRPKTLRPQRRWANQKKKSTMRNTWWHKSSTFKSFTYLFWWSTNFTHHHQHISSFYLTGNMKRVSHWTPVHFNVKVAFRVSGSLWGSVRLKLDRTGWDKCPVAPVPVNTCLPFPKFKDTQFTCVACLSVLCARLVSNQFHLDDRQIKLDLARWELLLHGWKS